MDSQIKDVINGLSSVTGIVPEIMHQNLTLTQQIFELLYQSTDIFKVIDLIFEILGKSFEVSRVYIFEDTPDHLHCTNTFEWCADGITAERDTLQHLSYSDDLGGRFHENFDNNGIFYCPDITKLPREQCEILAPQGIKAMLQCSIVENGVFCGFMGLDDCRNNREWSEEQRYMLLLICKIIGMFLCKKRREEALLNSNRALTNMINRIPGGNGIYKIINGTVVQLYLSDGFFRMLGYTRLNYEKYNGTQFLNAIHPEDIDIIKNIMKGFIGGDSHHEAIYRMQNGKGEYIWCQLIGDAYHEENGQELIYCSFFNVDEQMKDKVTLHSLQALSDVAMQKAGMSAWEYYPNEKRAVLTEAAQRQHGMGRILENLPESMIKQDYVHPDSVEDYRKLFYYKFPDKKSIQQDICVRTADRTSYWWERYILMPIYNKKGELIKTVGTSVDVTEQKRIETKYKHQLAETDAMDSADLIAKYRFSITKNKLEYMVTKSNKALTDTDNISYDEYYKLLVQSILEVDGESKCNLADISRKGLTEQYKAGRSETSLIYLRKLENKPSTWVQVYFNLFLSPQTEDIMCFVYSYDITEKKTAQMMIDAVVQTDYDYLALLDSKTKQYDIISYTSGAQKLSAPHHTSDFDEALEEYAKEYVAPEDQACYINQTEVSTICEELKKNDIYVVYYSKIESSKIISRKKLQFSFIDGASQRILVSRVDITDVYAEEQKRLAKVREANEAAKHANASKADFLSRMSHDIRTPMNAIIGLTELASDNLSDINAVGDYLKNIHSSGKFLLSLVNDCLDFEKMQSRKMVLKPEPYSYNQLRERVVTLIAPFAAEKEIALKITDEKKPYPIMVDPVRFEQVCINLLTNAVKYTGNGGTVEFSYRTKAIENGKISCVIEVKDNGIGMSESFQKRMFVPFEQENGNWSQKVQGTGLGLAIVKSIVDLMGGRISVVSKPYEGTKFKVSFALQTAENYTPPVSVDKTDYSVLDGKLVLVVEDQPINALIVQKLLERKNISTLSAENGREGVDIFARSKPFEIDAILMDVNMPTMNGLESARAIRALPRGDASEIPIIAMTANAFEEDVKATLSAGMTEHLSKPVEPEKLYSAIARLTSAQQYKKQ